MRHLNYNHLQYFWVVAREGSIVKASEVLHLTPQTISGQLKLLDESVGQALFNRSGRRLVLSEMGRLVFDYADDIFSIGSELSNVVRGQQKGGPSLLSVGVVSSMPKLIVERIIAPTLVGEDAIRVRCSEATLEQLLGSLAVHKLDLVLSDQPMPRGLNLRAYNHLLGASGLTFFAPKRLARSLKGDFPDNLDGAPMLLPSANSALRRGMDEWFETRNLSPNVIGEFDDSALLKAFGEAGVGVFGSPTVIEEEVRRMYRVTPVGRTTDVSESFYAISPERKLKHESVVKITELARDRLFAD